MHQFNDEKTEAPNYYIISDTNVSIFYVMFFSPFHNSFQQQTERQQKNSSPFLCGDLVFFLHYLRTSLFVYTIHSKSTKELRLGSPIVASLQQKKTTTKKHENEMVEKQRQMQEINIISPDLLITLLKWLFLFFHPCALCRSG